MVGVLNTVNVLMAGITVYAYYADCDPLVDRKSTRLNSSHR